MTRPEHPEQRSVSTSILGRVGRLTASMARTGLALGWKRLRTGDPGLDAAIAQQLALSFGTLKGMAMKAGQLLSYTHESLPSEVRQLLATLQTDSPRLPFAQIVDVVREELGARGEELLERMEPEAVAAASIGQVHRSRLPDGATVAVKVQYPGIERALSAEFRAASAGIGIARLLLPEARLEDFLNEARERILLECDYVQELRWQLRFRELYRDHPMLSVPAGYPAYTTRRVLTSEWVEGLRFDAWLERAPAQPLRDRVGVALYEFYLGSLLRHGLFNADPHPGNYLFTAGDRLVILDYGAVREYPSERVAALVALRDAVRHDEPAAIRPALVAIGAREPESAVTYDRSRALLRAFFSPVLEDGVRPVQPLRQSGLGELLTDKRALGEMRLPGDLLFLLRIRFGLHAVLARLGARADWYRLEEEWSSP